MRNFMTIINNFFNKIEEALLAEPSAGDWELFNDLEDYFIENNEVIFNESERVSDLGYEMQDIISEQGYMDDFSKCREKIVDIFNEMKKEYNYNGHTDR